MSEDDPSGAPGAPGGDKDDQPCDSQAPPPSQTRSRSILERLVRVYLPDEKALDNEDFMKTAAFRDEATLVRLNIAPGPRTKENWNWIIKIVVYYFRTRLTDDDRAILNQFLLYMDLAYLDDSMDPEYLLFHLEDLRNEATEAPRPIEDPVAVDPSGAVAVDPGDPVVQLLLRVLEQSEKEKADLRRQLSEREGELTKERQRRAGSTAESADSNANTSVQSHKRKLGDTDLDAAEKSDPAGDPSPDADNKKPAKAKKHSVEHFGRKALLKQQENQKIKDEPGRQRWYCTGEEGKTCIVSAHRKDALSRHIPKVHREIYQKYKGGKFKGRVPESVLGRFSVDARLHKEDTNLNVARASKSADEYMRNYALQRSGQLPAGDDSQDYESDPDDQETQDGAGADAEEDNEENDGTGAEAEGDDRENDEAGHDEDENDSKEGNVDN
ncbi:hypothetical protein H2200_008134 [Cladophialophora chaetospira]|uniref:Uncharacterized protein n=1 Tax=Cladophialophora chaetospira TaxID=386627 RepID=A0AA39CG51_9EURO|nr:hypothetical protein H2200_008134 [Cladophialophora chaetospira]